MAMGALVALCSALLAVAGASGPPSTCPDGEVHKGQTGTWVVNPGPRFPTGDTKIAAFAIDPASPEHQFATNGSVLLGSTDGGCSWAERFALPAQISPGEPLTAGNATLHALAARAGHVVVTAVGPGPPAPTTVTVAYSSSDGGRTFKASSPMPNGAAGPGPVVLAPGKPERAYLGAGRQVRRSDDGGATFTLLDQTVESDPASNVTGPIQSIAVDPENADVVIVRGAFTTWRSADAGGKFTAYGAQGEDPHDETVFGPAFGRGGRVVFTEGGRDTQGVAHRTVSNWLVSDDHGAAFLRRSPALFGYATGESSSMAAGTDPGDFVLTTAPVVPGAASGVYRWHPTAKRAGSYDEFGLAPLTSAQAEDGASPRFYFVRNGHDLVVWQTPEGGAAGLPEPSATPPQDPRDTAIPRGEPPQPEDVPKGPKATLAPGSGDVHVDPGSSTTVDYRLHLPRRPGRLDAFFLLDTSNSTDPYKNRLASNLTRLAGSLVDNGIDGWFGLGEYQDVERGNGGVRYRRRQDLLPPGPFLKKQFDSIYTAGGAEPGYTALEQMASGRGIETPHHGIPVKPGQQANWRKGTVRMVLHAADEPFAFDPDGPTPEATFAALKAKDIRFVGLLVAPAPLPVGQGVTQCAPVQDVPQPETPVTGVGPASTQTQNRLKLLCQMQQLARETKTLAPKGGVDCDGNGIVDLREGDPMVCIVTDGATVDLATIDDAVERLMLSYPLHDAATLQALGTPPVPVAITPGGDYSAIDARLGADGTFAVEFSCGAGQAGKAFNVDLEARLGDIALATAHPRVICGELPAAAAPLARAARQPPERPAPVKASPEKAAVIAALPAPVPALATAPVPPPPPALVPAPAPAPATAPAPASVSAQVPASAQATVPGQVAATAEEHQHEVAFQTVRVEDEPGSDELNFSRAEDPLAPGQWPWLLRTAGFAGVLAAAGAAARRRQKTTTTRKVHQR